MISLYHGAPRTGRATHGLFRMRLFCDFPIGAIATVGCILSYALAFVASLGNPKTPAAQA
jgi:hypothetical protein